MRISFLDQSSDLPALIPLFKRRPLSYQSASFPEKATVQPIVTVAPVQDLRRCNFDFLFTYDVFPPDIMHFAAEWVVARRPIAVGDVIIQQVFLPPLAVSVKCIFAVRILEITSTQHRVGFRYGTLEGHAETGVSEFVGCLSHGRLELHVRTRSRPATVLSRMLGPIMTSPYQRYCTARALEHMRSAFLRANQGLLAT